MPAQMTVEQFGASVKAKYPQYANIPDAEIGKKTLEKYPQYQRVITSGITPKPTEQGGGLGGFIKSVADPFLKAGGAITGTLEGLGHLGAAGLSAITGDQAGAQRQVAEAGQAAREGGVVGRATGVAPIGATGENPLEFAREIGSTGAEIASYLAPVGEGAGVVGNIAKQGIQKGLRASVPALGRAVVADSLGGAVGGFGQALGQKDATVGSVLKGTAIGAGASVLTGGVLRGLGGTGQAAGAISEAIFKKAPLESISSFGSRLANSIIKPLEREFRFGRDPGATVVKEGIVGNSLDDYAMKIEKRLLEYGEKMDAVLTKPENAAKKIDVKPAIDAIDASIKEAVDGGNTALTKRLREIKDGLEFSFVEKGGDLVKSEPRNLVLSPKEAQDLKIAIGKRIKWTGEAFGSEINQAQRSIYDSLNKLVNDAAPEMREFNERWGGLFSALKSIERTKNVNERGAAIRMSDVFTGAAGAATFGVAGLSAIGFRRFLESTAFKSRLSVKLAKFGGAEEAERLLMLNAKEQAKALEKIPLFQRPKIKAILDEAGIAMKQFSRTAAITSDKETQDSTKQ